MKAYQYEIESRLIKMLMCLCVVLSFAGCNSLNSKLDSLLRDRAL